MLSKNKQKVKWQFNDSYLPNIRDLPATIRPVLESDRLDRVKPLYSKTEQIELTSRLRESLKIKEGHEFQVRQNDSLNSLRESKHV